ncbi:MAG: recombinase family protein [Gemmataceae bacterium]
MPKVTAIYIRVSTKDQSQASQVPDLARYASSIDGEVRWFEDTFSGKSMKRPGMEALLAFVRDGLISRIVCWSLDRLGRTASGLSALFAELEERGIGLVSLREGLDLSTAAGRLLAHVIASVAQYETEMRAVRVKAGQDAARARGKTWGGSKPGRRFRVTTEKERCVLKLHEEGAPIARIAYTLSLSRPTIYAVLRRRGRLESKEAATTTNAVAAEDRAFRMPQELRRGGEAGLDTLGNPPPSKLD